MTPMSKPYSGTQAIVRASLIMKAIGASPHRGLRVVDICDRLQIERPTVHRILSCLVSEGLIVRDDNGKRYLLGEQLHRLGLLATSRFDLREICDLALTRIAAVTGDTVFLATRRGDDALVIDRRIGTTPARAMPLNVGMPRPRASAPQAWRSSARCPTRKYSASSTTMRRACDSTM